MYPEERQHAIAVLVGERGRVSVSAVAEEFGVTTETVRRDLTVLERIGTVRRTHGGAVAAGTPALTEPSLAERAATRAEQKRTIAVAALDFLPAQDGSILLDGGTTTGALADLLPADRRLLALTHCVPHAARLAATSEISLHLLGGRIRGVTQCAVGETTVRTLEELRVDVAFLGANGVTRHGFTTPDEAEASVKRAMVRAGQRVVVLADSSKLGREHLVRFACAADVDVLITDSDADPAAVAALEALDVEVVVA